MYFLIQDIKEAWRHDHRQWRIIRRYWKNKKREKWAQEYKEQHPDQNRYGNQYYGDQYYGNQNYRNYQNNNYYNNQRRY